MTQPPREDPIPAGQVVDFDKVFEEERKRIVQRRGAAHFQGYPPPQGAAEPLPQPTTPQAAPSGKRTKRKDQATTPATSAPHPKDAIPSTPPTGGNSSPPDPAVLAEESRKDLVGLALSGGGVRSASFNLGILQAFYQYGLLRWVDYLSTVSGGGYIGAFLSSSVSKLTQGKTLYKKSASPSQVEPGDLNIEPKPDGQQAAVRRIIHGGKYLNHPVLFFNRYLIGLILNNIVLFSGIICLCALLAYGWRAMDFMDFRWWLADVLSGAGALYNKTLQFIDEDLCLKYIWLRGSYDPPVDPNALGKISSDLYVPFLPAILFSGIWMFAWVLAISSRGRPTGRTLLKYLLFFLGLSYFAGCLLNPSLGYTIFLVFLAFLGAGLLRPILGVRGRSITRGATKFFLVLAAVSFLVGLSVLLGNGNITVGATPSKGAPTSGQVVIPTGLLFGLGIVLGICLLPLLRPWRLLASGQQPRSQLETYIFRITSGALIVGVPLFIVFLLARENISGHADYSVDEVKDWPVFCGHLKDGTSPAAGRIKSALANYDKSTRYTADLTDPDKTMLELLREDPVRTAGLLPDSNNTYVLRRRHVLLRALDQVLSQSDFATCVIPDEVKKRLVDAGQWQTLVNQLKSPPESFESLADDYRAQKFSVVDREHYEEESKKVQTTIDRAKTLLDRYWYVWTVLAKHPKFLESIRDEKTRLKFTDVSEPEMLKEWYKTDRRRETNHLLLSLYYPDHVAETTGVTRRAIVIDEDQRTRRAWISWAFSVFCISALLVNLNITSLHTFYRDQLTAGYIQQADDDNSAPLLKDMDNVKHGAPYHLFATSLTIFPGALKAIMGDRPDTPDVDLPKSNNPAPGPKVSRQGTHPDSSTDGFLFSQEFCGSETTGYMKTVEYEINNQDVSTADAMAISGAAVTPFLVENPLVRLLMLIFNLRLGQWVPNPRLSTVAQSIARSSPVHRSWYRRFFRPLNRAFDAFLYFLPGQIHSPTILGILTFSIFRKWEDRKFCFVTDGGHHENLGVWPLLQRRCSLIIACDATHDSKHAFPDFLRLCRLMRLYYGIEFLDWSNDDDDLPLPLQALRIKPDAGLIPLGHLRSLAARLTRQHYVVAKIKYPELPGITGSKVGYLVYVKASLTGDEDNDLLAFASQHSEFPHDPTSNPMFDENQVESYRQLGYHIGSKLCRDFQGDHSLWSFQTFAIDELVGALKEVHGLTTSGQDNLSSRIGGAPQASPARVQPRK